MIIPKIIHQTWKARELPHWYFHRSQNSVKSFFPGWDYRFWTDSDLDTLVRTNLPQFYAPWLNLSKAIKRVDIARYLILYMHGGVYADLDFIFTGHPAELFGYDADIYSYRSQQSIVKGWSFLGNAFLASRPRVDFWLDAVSFMLACPADTPVLEHTGPLALGRFFETQKSAVRLVAFGPEIFDNDRCGDGVGEHRYGYHMRAATWQR